MFEQAGSEFPFRVWLKTDAPLPERALSSTLNQRQLFGSSWQEPQTQIAVTLLRPERQGLFVMLFIVALVSLVLLGMRMKIFMAIKLGETVKGSN